MKIFSYMFFFLLLGYSASAQKNQVSLVQAKEAALNYSSTIKNGKLRIGYAEAGKKATDAYNLPHVSGTGAGVYAFKDLVQPIPGLLDKGLNNFYFAGVTAMQSIYSGGKIATGIQLANLQIEASKVLARQSTDSVLLMTTQKYWNIVRIQEQAKTIKANEALLNSVLKMQNNMLAAGLIARNDLLKVKVQLSRLLLNKSELNNGRMLALFDFAAYTGLPYDSLMVMQDTLDKKNALTLRASLPDTNFTDLNTYRLLALNVKGAGLQTRLAQSDNRPSVSVGLNAAQIGSFNNAFKGNLMPLSFVSLSIPISETLWGSNKQKLKQQKINEQIAQNDLLNGKDQLQTAIMKYWYDVKNGSAQISYAKENVIQATENLKVSQDNYRAGLAKISDLLEAQAEYQSAEVSLNAAFSDMEVKKANYLFVIGKINER